jgi:hypothetical protein
MKSGGIFIDQETRRPLDVGQLKKDFEECAELLSFFQAIDSKMITITLSEYVTLPTGIQHAWNIYKKAQHEKQQREKK